MMPPKITRNEELFRNYKKGRSFTELGEIHGIKRETAFKVVKMMKKKEAKNIK